MIESIHNRMLDTSVIILGIEIASAFQEFCVCILNTLKERENVELARIQAHPGSRPWLTLAPQHSLHMESTQVLWYVQYASISALFLLPPAQMQLPLLSHGSHKPSPCSQIDAHPSVPPHAATWGWRRPLSQASCLLHSFLYTLPYELNSSTMIAPNALYGFPPPILLKLPQLPHTRGLAFSPCCLCGIAQNPPFVIPAPPSQRKSIFPFQSTHVIQWIKRAIQIRFYLLY